MDRPIDLFGQVARPRRGPGPLWAAALCLSTSPAALAASPSHSPVIDRPALRHGGGASGRGAGVAPPAAPVWAVDKAASRLSFRATMGGRPLDGVFKSWDAQIAFDPHNLKASRAVVTVETASALTGEPQEDQLLPSPEWLWTRRFSKATLVTRSITQTAPGRYQAVAEIRIRGVSRRIAAPFAFALVDGRGDFQSTAILDRTTFGIGPRRAPMPIDPKLAVTLHVIAKSGR